MKWRPLKQTKATSEDQLLITRKAWKYIPTLKVLKSQFVFGWAMIRNMAHSISKLVFGSGVCFLILFVLMDAISLSLDLQRGLYIEKQNFALGTITCAHWSIWSNIPRKLFSVKYHDYVWFMHPIRLSACKTSSKNYQRPKKATKRSKKATVENRIPRVSKFSIIIAWRKV